MFITFEGIDGSGKSTQISLLADVLRRRELSVVCLREPGSTSVSESIRRMLLDSTSMIAPKTEFLLFCAARAQLTQEVILPELNNGSIVICDRYIDSTAAYQGYGRGLPLEEINEVNRVATNGLLPDLTFYLDITPEEAESRTLARDKSKDRMELAGERFFEKVRSGYLQLSRLHAKRYVVISSGLSVEQIHEKIVSATLAALPS